MTTKKKTAAKAASNRNEWLTKEATTYATTMTRDEIARDALREIKWIRSCNGFAECEPELWLEERITKIEAALIAIAYRGCYVTPIDDATSHGLYKCTNCTEDVSIKVWNAAKRMCETCVDSIGGAS